MREMSVAKLVMDTGLYPRGSIDSQHAGYIVEAMRAGVQMPPIIVDKKTLKVIDGFHRVTAMRRLYGADGRIAVILKVYKSEQDMFLDAIRYNAGHGRTLSPFDKARCIKIAEEMKITTDVLAGALMVSVDKVRELRATRFGFTKLTQRQMQGAEKIKSRSARHGRRSVVLKRTIQHMAGEELTTAQVKANDGLDGHDQLFTINQLITLLETGLIRGDDDRLVARLHRLHELIGRLFYHQKEAAA